MPDSYTTGTDAADNSSTCSRDTRTTTIARRGGRTGAGPPRLDRRGPFSAVPRGQFPHGFCDGSVRAISYSIEPASTPRRLIRADGLTIDGKKL